eukprot:CAMPEP_0170489758 /NCGR_PEP_ID=MMETSP0208-20121228/8059_1 /TAXON_ID=197538 /ORGANISM="Strombidium inclinatum, Strain S3" /LENGTH=197 /DNA_ID=CAMNT_0010764825 /DNA_START=568 /DNA_END=1161 /DNA_ORIENTATION=+
MVLDTFSYPLATLNPDCKLTYLNPAFKKSFLHVLEALESVQLPRMESTQRSLELERIAGGRSGLCTLIQHFLKYKFRKLLRLCQRVRVSQRSKPRSRDDYLADDETGSCLRFNECQDFFESKIFKVFDTGSSHDPMYEPAQGLSLKTLLDGHSGDIQNLVFHVVNPLEPRKKKDSSETPSKTSAESLFLKVKFESLT